MSSGGIIWWQIGDSGGKVKYDCIIGFEINLISEWWRMDSGWRKEDDLWRHMCRR